MSNKVTVLLLGDFDPPTDDVRNACSLLLKRPEVNGLWICPVSTSKHVIDLSNIFCQQYYLETGSKVTCCTVAVNMCLNEEQLASWVRSKYPSEDFRVASLSPASKDRYPIYRISFGIDGISDIMDIPIRITKAPCVSQLIKDRIRGGRDESKKMFRVVWEHIQRNKLYRS